MPIFHHLSIETYTFRQGLSNTFFRKKSTETKCGKDTNTELG
jgi:hypothetical protein